MALELIYTSVPKGLLPGRTGFCTVAMTRGMSQQMANTLEGLVAYTPVFEHFSQNNAYNPASVFHYPISDGRNSFDLLARISSCGLDYTKRSNKIGHFILLSEAEKRRFSDGPSCLLNDKSLFATEWHGEPQYIPNERVLNANAVLSMRANAWEKATGDAGWAAWLAEWYLAKPDEPCFVIFDPLHHTNIQELVAESLMLLPKNKRWMVNWNTYMTALPLGLPSCNWRFCVANQSMMNAIGCTAGANVLDLRQRLGKAGESKLNQCARTGESPYVEQINLNPSPVSSTTKSGDDTKQMTLAERLEAQRQAQERERLEAQERARQEAQAGEKIPLSVNNKPAFKFKGIDEPAVEAQQSFEGIGEKKKTKPYLPFAMGFIIGFLLAVILCLTAYLFLDVNGKPIKPKAPKQAVVANGKENNTSKANSNSTTKTNQGNTNPSSGNNKGNSPNQTNLDKTKSPSGNNGDNKGNNGNKTSTLPNQGNTNPSSGGNPTNTNGGSPTPPVGNEPVSEGAPPSDVDESQPIEKPVTPPQSKPQGNGAATQQQVRPQGNRAATQQQVRQGNGAATQQQVRQGNGAATQQQVRPQGNGAATQQQVRPQGNGAATQQQGNRTGNNTIRPATPIKQSQN